MEALNLVLPYSLFQLVVLAICCASSAYWIGTRVSQRGEVLSIIFFAANPLLCRYAVTMWKDVLFAAFILLLVIYLMEIVRTEGECLSGFKGVLSLAGLSLLICLARSNGPYVLFILLGVLALVFRRYKYCIYAVFAGVLIGILIVGPIYNLFGIQKAPFREAIGMPLQQLALTCINDGQLSVEGQYVVGNLWDENDLKESFLSKSVDPVKSFDDEENTFLEDNKKLVLSVWVESMPSNLMSYYQAWRDLTIGYWYPGLTGWVSTSPGYSLGEGEIISSLPTIEHTGILVDTNVGKVFSSTRFVDFIRLFPSPFFPLFNIATMIWFVMTVLIFKLCRGSYDDVIPLLPLLGIWITFILSAPTNCEFRYALAFHLCLPAVATLFFVRLRRPSQGDGTIV